ncbi:sigma-70 family RNA polymerase sigma factor [Dyadobacter sp. CY107]|uniref:sigma-70 family RNA polymerase sigma factor n=1 Tax=Dyadobacter fanqingshengii TaxID=2906443 RepID=UPI001F22B48B|nr:sigma-70 family RNA polymerase sigma factor [Dyadobacter fanqingshengii]MCF2501913.1 sigma-70 family RNA polymerase sigma factor [Dyadobacter fanqingshengii]
MDLLKNYQKKLFPYAYNILGSAEDARDVVQDVMLKHLTTQDQAVENETGYLIRSVVNQSINLKKRNKKTVSESMWLPEPVEMTDTNMIRDEILSYSMLVLLEKLGPKERAVFILKEAFDYSHQEIAEALSFSVENSRKLLSRAKTLLKDVAEPVKAPTALPANYLQNYMHTIKNGNVENLVEMLSNDIIVRTDGGGKIKIVSELTVGASNAAELMLYVYKTYQHAFTIAYREVNHQPAILFYNDGVLVNCQIFEVEDSKIKQIYSVVDPAKLNSMIRS